MDGDLRGRLGGIRTDICPLYLLTGEYDFSCSPEDTLRTAQSIPGAQVEVMRELGHFPMSENPAQFRRYRCRCWTRSAPGPPRPRAFFSTGDMTMKIRYIAALSAGIVPGGAAQAQDTLTLGALVTLSGAGAAWGQGMKNAAEIAADQVNQAGGLDVGGRKYQVKVVAYDDKYQANEAVTVANRLVFEDKVKYIIGPVGSAPVLAIQPITEKNKVILMTLGFTSKALAADKPYTFRPNVTTAEVSQPQIDWLVKHQGIRKAGGLFPTTRPASRSRRTWTAPTARPARNCRPRNSSSATGSISYRS